MADEISGGVSKKVLEEMAGAADGWVAYRPGEMPYLHFRTSRGPFVIASSRLGISETPDKLGTCTTKVRPGNLRECLKIIDAEVVRIRQSK